MGVSLKHYLYLVIILTATIVLYVDISFSLSSTVDFQLHHYQYGGVAVELNDDKSYDDRGSDLGFSVALCPETVLSASELGYSFFVQLADADLESSLHRWNQSLEATSRVYVGLSSMEADGLMTMAPSEYGAAKVRVRPSNFRKPVFFISTCYRWMDDSDLWLKECLTHIMALDEAIMIVSSSPGPPRDTDDQEVVIYSAHTSALAVQVTEYCDFSLLEQLGDIDADFPVTIVSKSTRTPLQQACIDRWHALGFSTFAIERVTVPAYYKGKLSDVIVCSVAALMQLQEDGEWSVVNVDDYIDFMGRAYYCPSLVFLNDGKILYDLVSDRRLLLESRLVDNGARKLRAQPIDMLVRLQRSANGTPVDIPDVPSNSSRPSILHLNHWSSDEIDRLMSNTVMQSFRKNIFTPVDRIIRRQYHQVYNLVHTFMDGSNSDRFLSHTPFRMQASETVAVIYFDEDAKYAQRIATLLEASKLNVIRHAIGDPPKRLRRCSPEDTAAINVVVGLGEKPIWRSIPEECWENSYNVAAWTWPYSEVPPHLMVNIAQFDEVWALDQFSESAFARSIPEHVPTPVVLMQSNFIDQESLELANNNNHHQGQFDQSLDGTVVFVSDVKCQSLKNNVMDAVTVFQEALEESTVVVSTERSARLVIVNNCTDGGISDKYTAKLSAAMEEDERIRVVSSVEQIEHATAYLNLHLAEEADDGALYWMSRGVAVVAMDWAALQGLVRPTDGYVVPHSVQVVSGPLQFGISILWAMHDHNEAVRILQRIVHDPQDAIKRGREARARVEQEMTLNERSKAMAQRIKWIISNGEQLHDAVLHYWTSLGLVPHMDMIFSQTSRTKILQCLPHPGLEARPQRQRAVICTVPKSGTHVIHSMVEKMALEFGGSDFLVPGTHFHVNGTAAKKFDRVYGSGTHVVVGHCLTTNNTITKLASKYAVNLMYMDRDTREIMTAMAHFITKDPNENGDNWNGWINEDKREEFRKLPFAVQLAALINDNPWGGSICKMIASTRSRSTHPKVMFEDFMRNGSPELSDQQVQTVRAIASVIGYPEPSYRCALGHFQHLESWSNTFRKGGGLGSWAREIETLPEEQRGMVEAAVERCYENHLNEFES